MRLSQNFLRSGTGKMAQRLRVQTAFPQDLCSVPVAQQSGSQLPEILAAGDLKPSTGTDTHGIPSHRHVHVNKNKC